MMMAAASPSRGVLLVRATPQELTRWVRRGTFPVVLTEAGPWSALTVAGARPGSPDHQLRVELLASRPAPRRRRPAIGFFLIDERAVVTLTGEGDGRAGWLIWQSGVGQTDTPSLKALSLADLMRAAQAGGRASLAELTARTRTPHGTPLEYLTTVLGMLGLPGAELLTGSSPPGELVEPGKRGVAAFERLLAERADAADPQLGGAP